MSRKFSTLVLILVLGLPFWVSAYSISCWSVAEASGCNQCFRFELATSNGANDVFVPRASIPTGQQEFIDLAKSTIVASAYQGSAVSPVWNITDSFDRIEKWNTAQESWVWSKMKWQMISKNVLPKEFDTEKPLYGLKYTTVSYLKNAGQTVAGTEVTHVECGFFFVSAVCGNNKKEWSEWCDDGNTNNNDGCSNTCRLPVCGNNVREGTEVCDDGNTNNGDACPSTCHGTVSQCGNGIQEGLEECDDGNTSNTDTCNVSCKSQTINDGCRMHAFDSYGTVPLTTTLTCSGKPRGRSVIVVTKNNVVIETTETASTMFTFNQAGKYTVHCFPWVDIDNNASCKTVINVQWNCGNGILEHGEMCDDGNRISGDFCDKSCRLSNTTCGNGILEPEEQCDDGNNSNNDTCSNICQDGTPNSGPFGMLFILIIASLLFAGVIIQQKGYFSK